jgi:hypothetical protein
VAEGPSVGTVPLQHAEKTGRFVIEMDVANVAVVGASPIPCSFRPSGPAKPGPRRPGFRPLGFLAFWGSLQ